MRQISLLVLCMIALVFWTVPASAQTNPFQVNYFSNAHTTGAPDGTVRVVDPGAGASNATTGNICVNFYVFDPNEELSECCGCLNTPDGLAKLSINNNLTSNPLTGVTLTDGTIMMIGSLPTGFCNPTKIGTLESFTSWATHIQDTSFAVTESASESEPLSAVQLALLENQCASIVLVSSGSGICSCGTGK